MELRGLFAFFATQLINAAAITLSVPNDGISARLGREASLPCWVTPATNAEDMEVRWYQSFDNPVLLYRDKKIQNSPVQAEYVGRTSFGYRTPRSEGLKEGDLTLKLTNVTLKDAGEYTCYASQSAGYDNVKVSLSVTVMGTPPLLSVVGTTSGSVNVSCESHGWHPQPRLHWSDGQQSLLPQSLNYSRDDHGLVGVHSWLVSSSPWVSCSLSLSPEEEWEGRVDLKSILATDVPSGGWKAAFIILLVLLILTTIGVLLLYIKKKDEQTRASTVLIEPCTSFAALDDVKKHRAVNITLDKSTASEDFLTVSKDAKIVRDRGAKCSQEDWFLKHTFILGEQEFSSGCAYWEVRLGANGVDLKESWQIGLASSTVKQQGLNAPVPPSPGFWFLSSEKGEPLKVYSEISIVSFGTQRPEILGVYLEYDEGKVSFYNVKDQKGIATLATKFTGVVSPFFNPGMGDKAPLTIIDIDPKAGQETENGPDGVETKQSDVPPERKTEQDAQRKTETSPLLHSGDNLQQVQVHSIAENHQTEFLNPGIGDRAPLTVIKIDPKAGQESENSPDGVETKQSNVPPVRKTEQDAQLKTETSPLLPSGDNLQQVQVHSIAGKPPDSLL